MDQRKRPSEKKMSILSAAKILFAEQGFAGTSIRDIASKAKASLSMIYHYFGDKEKLWHEVKRTSLAGDEFDLIPLEVCQTLDDFLNYIIRKRFDVYEKRPDIVRMVGWQNLESMKKDSDADELLGNHLLSPLSWIDLIKTLQKNKEVRDDVEPEILVHYISNASTGIFYAPASQSGDPALRARYLDFVVESLKKTLSPVV